MWRKDKYYVLHGMTLNWWFTLETIPFVVKAYISLAINILHASCKAQHGRIVISFPTTVMRSLAVMPHILTLSSEGVWMDTSWI